eukprot:gene16229-22395_t
MATVDPLTKFRNNYKPTPYLIKNVELDFILNEDESHVHSILHCVPNPNSEPAPMVLDGRKDLTLVSIKIDGADVPADKYTLDEKTLTISELPATAFKLAITTSLKPQDNSLLEGLYKSGGNFSTQCEAEGFRGITYFYDRPDVMSVYTTRIEADKTLYPVLLGNGNLKEEGDLEAGRHFTIWFDPFPKPCYLFAVVAGNLAMKEKTFTTCSGKNVDHALDSLIKAMKWDEDTFGLEYDLDLFNIVAVDDFNMGAMENKSLNIFNSRLVLASPTTATDLDYSRIEAVVGHEYFHNWTGNRVTCRDWFQLTLKEGLTVFRDGEFSSDMNSRLVRNCVYSVKTVILLSSAPVLLLRHGQQVVTVYEKGAEVIHMYKTLLGKAGFRKGMDLYFKRHDGQAVTCDDFRAAMADANGEDLSGLETWYLQAGTPQLEVSTVYDAAAGTFTLKCKQTIPATPGQASKMPTLIPIAVGLVGPDGQDMPLKLTDSDKELGTTAVLRFTEAEQSFTFTNITSEPTPSILRDFSAPVKLTVHGQTDEQLLFLFANDSDPVNRWEAGQCIARNLLLKLYSAASDPTQGATVTDRIQSAGGVSDSLVSAFKTVLTDEKVDGMFKAMAVTLPSGSELYTAIPSADPTLIHEVRSQVVKGVAARLRPELEAIIKLNDDEPGAPYVFEANACGRRAIKNKAITMLSTLEDPEITQMVLSRFRGASNMTDEIAALSALTEIDCPDRDVALAEFFKKYESEPLVILKWLTLQATCNMAGNTKNVKALVDHASFNISNPNNCYSLFLAFARSPINFHAADGSGYEFMADSVLKAWRQFDSERQGLMKACMEKVSKVEGLSDNVKEIATKALA